MERMAWLAWHYLLPYQKEGSTLTPRDLLRQGKADEAKRLTKEEAQRELEALRREMGDL